MRVTPSPHQTSNVTTVLAVTPIGFSITLGAINTLSQAHCEDIDPENDIEPLPDSIVIVLEPSHTRTSIFFTSPCIVTSSCIERKSSELSIDIQ